MNKQMGFVISPIKYFSKIKAIKRDVLNGENENRIG